MSARFPALLQPLFGALLGVCGTGLVLVLPRGPGAIAALLLWTVAGLAQGELGFSRWLPRLPLFGTLLAGCTILLRWYSLISLENAGRLFPAVVAAMTLGPAAAIALAWVSRPLDDAAFRRLSVLEIGPALGTMAEGTAGAMLCGVRLGVVLVLVVWLLLRIVTYLRARSGGVRGSDLEAFRVVVETTALILLASVRDA